MELTPIAPQCHKLQTKLYKIPKFGVNRPNSNAPVKVNPRNPTPGKGGNIGQKNSKKEPTSPTPGQHFHSNGLAFPCQDIHFNHQFSSVNAWSTKRRKAGHLHAIKIEIH